MYAVHVCFWLKVRESGSIFAVSRVFRCKCCSGLPLPPPLVFLCLYLCYGLHLILIRSDGTRPLTVYCSCSASVGFSHWQSEDTVHIVLGLWIWLRSTAAHSARSCFHPFSLFVLWIMEQALPTGRRLYFPLLSKAHFICFYCIPPPPQKMGLFFKNVSYRWA